MAAPPAASDPGLELPPLFHAADLLSLAGQRRAFTLLFFQLAALVAAAAADWVDATVGAVRLAPALAGGLFLAALLLGLETVRVRPERQWYLGRALAESVKSLAWLYAVGGHPFPLGDASAGPRFEQRAAALLAQLAPEGIEVGTGREITAGMRDLRAAGRSARVAAYLSERIDGQVAWYSAKASANARRGRVWSAAFLLTSGLGVVAAGVEAWGLLDLGLFGFLASVGAAFSAWTQARQHSVLAASYAVAARELGAARAGLEAVAGEEEWARATGDAEAAISREHATWIARTSAMTAT
jgi:hypothetical protein